MAGWFVSPLERAVVAFYLYVAYVSLARARRDDPRHPPLQRR
jgi:hypothetical protein